MERKMTDPTTEGCESVIENANTALERIRWHQKNLDSLTIMYEEERRKILDKIAFHESNLHTHASTLRKTMGKSRFTLPAGSVSMRMSPGKTVIEDKSSWDQWVSSNIFPETHPDLFCEPKPSMPAIKGTLKWQDSGDAVFQETGEVVPGIKREAKSLSMTYKLPD